MNWRFKEYKRFGRRFSPLILYLLSAANHFWLKFVFSMKTIKNCCGRRTYVEFSNPYSQKPYHS